MTTTDLPTFRRTRLAPTPSGFLHLGNIMSFAITAWLAEKTGARILLRIDDMDHERTDKKYVRDIFDTLHFLEIPWHDGPKDYEQFEREYSQRHRMSLYMEAVERLKQQGHLFACSCSRSRIAARNVNSIYTGTCRDKQIPFDSENVSWRLRTPVDTQVYIKTLQGRAEVPFPESVRDFIVRKKDGTPAYQLSSVIDDLYFDVDMVVRGQDLWDSTIAQLYLASELGKTGFGNITFYHHPLMSDATGLKLSKSAGATSVQYLRKEGKTQQEIYTLIADLCGLPQQPASWRELAEVLASADLA